MDADPTSQTEVLTKSDAKNELGPGMSEQQLGNSVDGNVQKSENSEEETKTETEFKNKENELDKFIKSEFGENDNTFLTSVPMIDDSGRGEGVGKRMLTKEDEDLGIYEDTDDGDDLTDNELELERLRAEKQKRDEEERKAREQKEAEVKAAEMARLTEGERLRKLREEEDRETERKMAEAILQFPLDKSDLTPRTDGSLTSRSSIKTWSDPRFLQGLSLKEMYWKSLQGEDAVMTSMASQIEQSINASRIALESREAMFRRAMSLLSARCTTSIRQDADGDKLALGAQLPKYFFVTQDKPVPMEPLKAWRGYNGNIYFEPININPLKVDMELERAKTSISHTAEHPRMTSEGPKPKTSQEKENRVALQESRSDSRQTNKSSGGSRRSSNNRPQAYLDKQTVLTRFNDSIQEDIVWLEGQESTGSLAVRPKTYPDRLSRDKELDLQYNKERIRKGSVAHRLYVEKSRQKPKLSVSGGKFTPPTSLSPLLRTQTQYSLSSNRLTTNSPDLYHLNESKFPPLTRSGTKRENFPARTKMPYTRSLTFTDDMKPFVKYSPDVLAKFSQQANIC